MRHIVPVALTLLASLPLYTPWAVATPIFVDATDEAGLVYVQHDPVPEAPECRIEGLPVQDFCGPARMSGGAAVGDYDGDGWDDLFVTRFGQSDLLFRNNADGTFTETASASGITDVARTNSALWVDIDQDGDLDLLVSSAGEMRNFLYVNNGAGHFSEEARERGFALENGLPQLQWALAAGDYDGDGWVDLFTAEWSINFFTSTFKQHHSRLLRNVGPHAPGYFEDVTVAAEVDLARSNPQKRIFGFSATFTDLDMDDHLDLVVTSDYGFSQLYWNNGDGTFTNGTAAAGVGTDENGMGATFGDYDGDGDLDYFVTSIFDAANPCAQTAWGKTGNRLYANNGDRTFFDVTDNAGVREGGWGWGASFFDYDNDADLDLVMTNGMYFPNQLECLSAFINEPMRFWENDGAGVFTERAQSVGITDSASGKGLITWDYDRDGDLDIFVVNNTGVSVLYRNDSDGPGHWIRVRFGEGGRVHEGLNARLSLQAGLDGPVHVREMGVATHFLGQSERVAHFGLGDSIEDTVYRLTVFWPRSGVTQTVENLTPDTETVIEVPDEEIVRPDHRQFHDADYAVLDGRLDFSELLRLVQLYNSDRFCRTEFSEDGFATGGGDTDGRPHELDYSPTDWNISLSELLRGIQFFTAGGYRLDVRGEDTFMPETSS